MTEKDYNPEQRNKKTTENQKIVGKAPVSKEPENKIASAKAEEIKKVDNVKEGGVVKPDNSDEKDAKPSESEKKQNKKSVVKTTPKVKKSEAVVKGMGLPLSTKTSVAICNFIRGKQIPKAIADLEQVIVKKKAVAMKGEIPHRKGKIMSGRFPKNASESFIRLLKNLQANANVNGLDEPIVAEAMANIASQPYGRFGRVRRKRTHVVIKVKEHRSVHTQGGHENLSRGPKTLNKGAKK